MRSFKTLWPLLAIVILLIVAGDALACPNCKEAIENQHSPEGAGLRAGYFWSILLMISVPMCLFSTGFFMVVRAVKRGSLPEL